MKKWYIGEIAPVTQIVFCTITVAKTFKKRARFSMRVRTSKLSHKYLFIKAVQTMVIAMSYGGSMKQIEQLSLGSAVTAMMMSPFKVRTTARVFNMMLLLNPLPT